MRASGVIFVWVNSLIVWDDRCDEGAKATAYLVEASKMKDAAICPFNLAYKYDKSIFRWLAESEGNWRGERMGKAMQQLHRVVDSNTAYGKGRILLLSDCERSF